jgi:hypothetical protein
MLRRIITVSTKGELVIPSEMDKTRGLFSGKASLSNELKRQRHQKVRW